MQTLGPDPADECGCAPSPRELRTLRSPVTRRLALGLGVAGVVGLAGVGTLIAAPAFAATYPSWDDVENARANESAKADEIARIQQLIADLENDVAVKQARAEELAAEYVLAQEEFEKAAQRADDLQAQADAEAERADAAAAKLGQLAAQQYRVGGDDTSLELFFSSSAGKADDLLARLGTMDKLQAANRSVYTEAISARDNAQNLSDQAKVARNERDRLQKEAESKMIAAQEAAQAAQAALDAQNQHRETLEAQLAALQDTTARTIADYQAGVEARRKAREERLRREREEAERAAAAELARLQAEQARSGGSSSGGGSSGGSSSSRGGGVAAGGSGSGSGWVRPAGGSITSWFGNRGTICSGGYCTTSGHRGIDFGISCGAPIYAAASGTVVFAAYSGAWGNYIKVDHGGGTVTGYAHIKPGGYAVRWGQRVSAGQVIAYAGTTGASTGCHLHFEVYRGGLRIDPAPFLRSRGVSV
ncbi:peptidoglycan DD-metalloendopeptidase family protein [Microbacterium sp.]|uniref:peptidoglycan DD-metalloendopeptidase family protein n=1 Tax=Microbacterium sp. TaxID=51671 RepID=UPI003A8B147E